MGWLLDETIGRPGLPGLCTSYNLTLNQDDFTFYLKYINRAIQDALLFHLTANVLNKIAMFRGNYHVLWFSPRFKQSCKKCGIL